MFSRSYTKPEIKELFTHFNGSPHLWNFVDEHERDADLANEGREKGTFFFASVVVTGRFCQGEEVSLFYMCEGDLGTGEREDIMLVAPRAEIDRLMDSWEEEQDDAKLYRSWRRRID
jgi:hypothetical protein